MRLETLFAPLLLAILTGCGSAPETSATVLGAAPRCAAADDNETRSPVSLTLGVREGEVFTALRDGDPLVIIDGRQGGTWVMPTLRLQGASTLGTVSGGISLAGGREVGDLPPTSAHAAPVAGGSIEVEYVPIPIGDNPDGSLPEGVDGSAATVRLTWDGACGETGSLDLDVVLVYEPTD